MRRSFTAVYTSKKGESILGVTTSVFPNLDHQDSLSFSCSGRENSTDNEAEEVVRSGGTNIAIEILGAPEFGGASEAEDSGEKVQAYCGPRQLLAPSPGPNHFPLQVVMARRVNQGAEHAAPIPGCQAEDQNLQQRVQLG